MEKEKIEDPFVPPADAANEHIRVFAWKQAKANYRQFVMVALIGCIPLIASLFILFDKSIFVNTIWATLILYLLRLAFTPLTIGVIAYSYDIYLYGTAGYKKIFSFYKEKRSLITSFLLGLFNIFLSSAYTAANRLIKIFTGYNPWIDAVLSFVSFIVFIFLLYFTTRFYLLTYVFINDANKNVRSVIKEGFAYTKGWVHRIFWFEITVIWWIIILIIGCLIVFAISCSIIKLFIENILWLNIYYIFFITVMFITYIFAIPYVNTALAGYAHKILLNNNPSIQDKN